MALVKFTIYISVYTSVHSVRQLCSLVCRIPHTIIQAITVSGVANVFLSLILTIFYRVR